MTDNYGYQLTGKRVVITNASGFMGPNLVEAFTHEGANVIPDHRDLTHSKAADNLANEVGELDILIVNLAAERPNVSAIDITDNQISTLFEEMVYPLMRVGRSVLPQMIARNSGKIVVISSASALRGFANSSAYASARGAQLAWVKATGAEVAADNVQVNAIAQIFVENPEYFSTEYQKTEEFQQRIRQVPAGRLGTGAEAASVALFLASENCNFMVGQVTPVAGGWAT